MQQSWQNKVNFDARIDTKDLAHKLVDVLEALLVAVAALHVASDDSFAHLSPLQIIRDIRSSHAWGFSVSLFAVRALSAARWFEVSLLGSTLGTSTHAKSQLAVLAVSCFFFAVSAYFSNVDWAKGSPPDLACFFWFFAVFSERLLDSVVEVTSTSHPREARLPAHIDYVLHRSGEWVMLMIGESMLSLVVGATLNAVPSFYAVFACCFISTTCLQFIHYSTQPFEAEHHALKRSAVAGVLWSQAVFLYSCSLIAFGVAVKLILSYHDVPVLPVQYAWLYSVSFGASYVLVQFMTAQHKGMTHNCATAQTAIFLLAKAIVVFVIVTIPLPRLNPVATSFVTTSIVVFAVCIEAAQSREEEHGGEHHGHAEGAHTASKPLAEATWDEAAASRSPTSS